MEYVGGDEEDETKVEGPCENRGDFDRDGDGRRGEEEYEVAAEGDEEKELSEDPPVHSMVVSY